VTGQTRTRWRTRLGSRSASGPRFLVYSGLSLPAGHSSLSLYAYDRYRLRPHGYDSTVVQVPRGNVLALGVRLERPLSPVLSLAPNVEFRHELAGPATGSFALLGWLVRFRPGARDRAGAVVRGERFFVVLELVLVVALVVTLIPAGTLGRAFGFPWILLWALALLCVLPWLRSRERTRSAVAADGTVAAPARVVVAPGFILTTLALISVLAIRAAVIFSAQ